MEQQRHRHKNSFGIKVLSLNCKQSALQWCGSPQRQPTWNSLHAPVPLTPLSKYLTLSTCPSLLTMISPLPPLWMQGCSLEKLMAIGGRLDWGGPRQPAQEKASQTRSDGSQESFHTYPLRLVKNSPKTKSRHEGWFAVAPMAKRKLPNT